MVFDKAVKKSTFIWSAVVAVLVLLLLAVTLGGSVDPQKIIDFLNPVAPIVAAGIATLALVWNATNTYRSGRRAKREATIEAWVAWSEATDEDRMTLSKLLGTATIGAQQAKALVEPGVTLQGKSQSLSMEEKQQAMHSITKVLNGLERLAVGVELGVFDLRTLEVLGGTIIKRSRERFAPYIVARREDPDLSLRQTRAYLALDKLAADIQQRHVDRERLTYLRKQKL